MANTQIDDRLVAVDEERENAISDSAKMYSDMASKTDEFYDKQIKASEDWAAEQKANQQAQTDFAIEKIEQQKDQAHKDYIKEQSGAYADWQKESNRYGVNAEMMAANGLANSGYSESSQVSMYNTYQNRIASARQSYELAKQNYDNAITEARLQNNSVLAEIAYKAYQQQLELSLQGFQYKNQLLMEGANKQLEINKMYDNKYLGVLDQINNEAALKQQREIADAKSAENGQDGNSPSGIVNIDPGKIDSGKIDISALENPGIFKDGFYDWLIDRARSEEIGKGMQKGQAEKSSDGKNLNQTAPSSADDKKESTEPYELGTPYYRGKLNPDIQFFGTFNNGYQPKGISGHGWLKKTGEKEEVHTVVQYGKDAGKNKVVMQNVWQAEDGTKWLWNGVQNRYEKYPG